MIKNRTAQIIFQTVYCTLGLIGFVASMGIFDDVSNFRWDFYVHFTNLSNFLCIGIMFAELVSVVKRKGDGYVTVAPMLKFIAMIGILLTFLMFNILLAGAEGRDPQLNWRVGSIVLHVLLPVMYVADWFLFYERKKTRWFYPFAAILHPAVYAVFIYTQAAILGFDSSILMSDGKTPLIYPYFFLNLENGGVLGVAKWFSFLFVALTTLGYILFALDRIGGKNKKTEN